MCFFPRIPSLMSKMSRSRPPSTSYSDMKINMLNCNKQATVTHIATRVLTCHSKDTLTFYFCCRLSKRDVNIIDWQQFLHSHRQMRKYEIKFVVIDYFTMCQQNQFLTKPWVVPHKRHRARKVSTLPTMVLS